ncbi:hypothetical protein M413DRAFT_312544 [Hebeloma cylindrosporum]|uniref:Uncharacterized protein n=1 Tax=Hebeloma cylindrosporum TaxID=76867 RepID=A0A0C2YZG4_HEBCY|nr:hypothetical protein M413DRAFT_312544 [Hebeloma cylindrosporum h7]
MPLVAKAVLHVLKDWRASYSFRDVLFLRPNITRQTPLVPLRDISLTGFAKRGSDGRQSSWLRIQVALGKRGRGMEVLSFKYEIRVSCIGFRYSGSASL